MDAKALAKSKRAHTLHHSKKQHHHHPASKGSSTRSSSSDDKSTVHIKPRDALPSNWDRYDLGSEEVEEETSTREHSDVVVLKSKGADYAYLISEAKSQYQSQSVPNYSSSELLDDDLMSLSQGVGSLLAAKGQNLLSWIEDDAFELEDDASTSFEVPFLSLNLNALAQQLSKSKLSERLFIPPETLPAELLDDELQMRGKDKNDHQASASAVAVETRTTPFVPNHDPSKIQVQHHREPVTSSTTSGEKFLVQASEEETKPVKKIEENIRELPISEAANAEEELDMLLNSFGEVKVSGSLSASSVSIPSIGDGSDKIVMRETNMRKVVTSYDAINIDDDIDRLFEETSSNLTKIDGREPLDGVKSSATSALDVTSMSKLQDDFDSWLDTI